jgi:hypothetical protein
MTRILVSLAAVVTIVLSAGAQAAKPPVNLADLSFATVGVEKISVQKLGSDTDIVLSSLDFQADGVHWSSLDEESLVLSGTAAVSGTTATMTYDADARDALRAALEDWVQEMADSEGLGLTVSLSLTSVSSTAKFKVSSTGAVTAKYKTSATFTATGGPYAVRGKLSEKGIVTEAP